MASAALRTSAARTFFMKATPALIICWSQSGRRW
jgi:hypothetical protein